MLLQAYDFAHMYRTMGVELQMGGADQWGNITAGLELIRRTSGRERDGAPSRRTASPTSCCCRRRGRSSGRARAASRSGSTRRGPARSPSTSTGSTPTTATSARTCAGSPSSRASGSRRSRPRPAARPGGAGRPARAGVRHHRPDPRGGGRRARRRRFGGGVRGGPVDDPAVLASLYASAGGFEFDRGWLASGDRGPARRGRRLRLAWRGAPDDRGRRRDRQRRRGSATPTCGPEPIAGEWLDVRIGKRRREIGRARE